MASFKDTCVALRHKDYTITEIMEETGRPKTSIYFHIQKIPLSSGRKDKIRLWKLAHLRQLAEARRGKSVRAFKKIERWDNHAVFLLSHFIFDGEINERKGGMYNNRSGVLMRKMRQTMRSFYAFEPKEYFDKKTGVYRIAYFNVALAAHLKKKAEELLNNISFLSVDLKREFLRSFFNDEGCMDFRPQHHVRQIRGYQKNIGILLLIKKLLADFDILSSVKNPNEVVISGRNNLSKFEMKINFSSGVCINGNRSNSRWKNNIQKKELLRRALVSYKN